MKGIDIFSFNWFDYTIICIVLLSLIVSLFRGFLREAVSLLIWIFAVLLGLKFAPAFSGVFSAFIHSPMLRYFIAFLCILLVVLLVGAFINLFVKTLVEKTGLGFFDHLLGVIFGAARGILLAAVVILFLQASAWAKSNWLLQSELRPQFQPLVTWLNTFIPEKVKQVADWVHGDNKA